MKLRSINVSIPIAILLLVAACSPVNPGNLDGDDSLSRELGAESLSDLRDESSTDFRMPPCELVGGCPVDLPVTRPIVYRFWGATANDVWAVGKNGLTMNWNGTSWRRFGSPAKGDLWAVWGTASSDVWAVGNDTTIVHWDGSVWTKVTGLTLTTGFNDIWGTSANDVWAVGDSGGVAHWDGTKWSPVNSGYTNGYMTVWGAASNDVWIGGEAGLLLHWDGMKMNEIATATGDTIWRIRGSAANNVYMTTDGARASTWDGSKWTVSKDAQGQETWVVNDSKVWLLESVDFMLGTMRVIGAGTYFWNGLIWTYKSVARDTTANAIWTTAMDGWLSAANGTMFRLSGTDWVKW